MSVMEIGKELVALCQQGKNLEAIEKWYHPDVVSVEACAMPEMEQIQRGIEAIKKKNKWCVVLPTLKTKKPSRTIARPTQVRRKQESLVIQTHAKFAFLGNSAVELHLPDC